jgi:hypothetical protein
VSKIQLRDVLQRNIQFTGKKLLERRRFKRDSKIKYISERNILQTIKIKKAK